MLKTIVRLSLILLFPIALFFSCGASGGAGFSGGTPTVSFSVSVQLADPPNGDIFVANKTVRAAPGTEISLWVEPDTGYSLATLTYFDGKDQVDIFTSYKYDPDNAGGYASFPMPACDTVVTGTFEHNARVINQAIINPAGAGRVTTTPRNIARYTDDVVVNVRPTSNYRIAKGTADKPAVSYYTTDPLSPTPLYAPYGFTMPDADVTITANFDQLYNVAISNDDDSKGTVALQDEDGNITQKFGEGDKVQVVTTPPANHWYVVDTVKVIDPISGDIDISNTNFFTMPSNDVTVVVTHKLNPANSYNVLVAQFANGTIAPKSTSTGNGARTQATAAQTVYLDIQPVLGYELNSANLTAGSDVNINFTGYPPTRPTFIMPAHDVTVNEVTKDSAFRLANLAVTGTAYLAGTTTVGGGTVSPRLNGSTQTAATAQMGQILTLNVTPNTNYRLKTGSVKYVYNNGTPSTLANSPYSFTMPPYSVNASAEFERTYTVTPAYTSSQGTVTVSNASGATTYAAGDRVNVSIVPKTGYLFDSITVNTDKYTSVTFPGYFTMPAANVTVTVTFVTQVYSIAVASIPNGKIIAPTDAPFNSTVNLSIQPDPGYKLTSGSLKYNPGNGSITDAGAFTMPASTVTISGQFEAISYAITSSPGSGGTIAGLPKTATVEDQKISFTVTPLSTYRLKAGSVMYSYNGTSYTPSLSGSTYSFTMPPYPVTVSASFEQLFPVAADTANNPPFGNVSITNSGGVVTSSFAAGDTVNVGVNVTNSLYVVNTISIDYPQKTTIATGSSSAAFTMPGGPVKVAVSYGSNPKNLYPIDTSDLSNGTGASHGTIQVYSALQGGTLVSSVKSGDTVYLAIQPELGYQVSGATVSYGTGTAAGTIPVGSYLLTRPAFTIPAMQVGQTVKITAVFSLINYMINTALGTGGSIQNLASSATMGNTVNFTVNANSGYRVQAVSVKSTANSAVTYPFTQSGSAYSFTMPTDNVTVNVSFVRVYTVSQAVQNSSWGKVSITNTSGVATDTFAANETAKINVNVTNGLYVVTGISVDTVAAPQRNIASGSSAALTFTMPAENVMATVTYGSNPGNAYPIGAPDLSNGTIQVYSDAQGGSPLSTVQSGQLVYLDVQPEQGYELIGNIGYTNGNTSGSVSSNGYQSNRLSLTIPADMQPGQTVTLSADFELINYPIKSSVTAGGSITGLAASATMGKTVTFTVSVNDTFRLQAVSVKSTANDTVTYPYSQSGSGNAFTFTMPPDAVTVNVSFVQLYTVSQDPQNAPYGTVSITNASGTSTNMFAKDDWVTVNVNVTDGQWVVGKISIDNPQKDIATGSSAGTFQMPQGNVKVTVTYVTNPGNQYPIGAAGLSHGAIQVYSASSGGSLVSTVQTGQTVYLAVQPELGYQLSGNTIGYKAGTITNTIPADNYLTARLSFSVPGMQPGETVSFSATFVAINYSITASPGTGGSLQNQAGSAPMASSSTVGQVVNFSVKPDANYRLHADSVKCTYTEPGKTQTIITLSDPYQFTMPAANVTVSATFDYLNTVTLSMPANGSAAITDAGGNVLQSPARFGPGDTVKITTTPNEGYFLDSITENGTLVSGGSFSMPSTPVTVIVTFKTQVYSVIINTTLYGQISAQSPSGAYGARMGDTVYLTMQPEPGYVGVGNSLTLSDSNVILTTSTSNVLYYFTMPAHDVTVSGTFALTDLNITVMDTTGGGTIAAQLNGANVQTAQKGNSLTLDVKPSNTYRVKAGTVKYSYIEGGVTKEVYLGAPYAFTMPAYDITVSAAFERIYSVTVSPAPDPNKEGTVSVTNISGAATFAEGDVVNVNVTPNSPYRVTSIIESDSLKLPQEIIDIGSFVMPAANVTIAVTFEIPAYNISASWTGSGFITASVLNVASIKANAGELVTLTLQPSTGYKYNGSITITPDSGGDPITPDRTNDVAQSTAIFTFTMPRDSVTVSSGFVKKIFNIQKENASPPNGSISFITPASPNGGTVSYNDTVVVKASPDNGYRVNSMTLYYIVNGQPSTAIDFAPQGANNYQYQIQTDYDDGVTLLVHVDFVPAIFTISVPTSVANGSFVFWNKSDPSKTPILSATYLDTVVAQLTLDNGYYYSGGFKVNSNASPAGLVVTPGPTQATVQFEFTMTPQNAQITATITANKYTLVLGATQNGTATMSTSTVNDGASVNFTLIPATGYKVSQVLFRSRNSTAQKDNNIVNSISNNQYTITMSDFTGLPLNGDIFDVSVVFIPMNNSLSFIQNPNVQIRLTTLQGTYLGQNTFVPTGSQIAVTLSSSLGYRYKPGSLKLNGVAPADLSPGFISYYIFAMPAGNVVVSVDSEQTPYANILFDDPNMDSYIYFYGNKNEGAGDTSLFQIDEATPGQTVELRVQTGNETDGFQNVQNVVVKSWWLNKVQLAPLDSLHPADCKIPANASGKTLGVIVEIGGVPHSKQIPIN